MLAAVRGAAPEAWICSGDILMAAAVRAAKNKQAREQIAERKKAAAARRQSLPTRNSFDVSASAFQPVPPLSPRAFSTTIKAAAR